MRVYELAKKLGLESKEALRRLQDLGVDVASNFQAVDAEDAARLEASLNAVKRATEKTKSTVSKKSVAKKAVKKTATKKKVAKKATKKEVSRKKAAKRTTTKKKATKKKVAAKVATKEAPEAEGSAELETKAQVQVEVVPEAAVEAAPGEAVAAGAQPAAASAESLKTEAAAAAKVSDVEPVAIEEGISVKVLAGKLRCKPAEVIRVLVGRGVMANINQSLDAELALSVAQLLGVPARHLQADEVLLGGVEESRPEDLESRPPIVTIMGHVDHGKTLLLDAIRETNVVDKEMGGITQHIGASTVEHEHQRIVFIDTPGHEAFTRMRARGAQVTDLVVLVVAADDGIMPQTLEAIDHARAAEVPIVVAINKTDRPDANIDRVKQQLNERGLVPEDWGGETVTVPVSAKLKENLKLLLEMITLTADLQELKANPKIPARGTVLEAELDRHRGAVASLLIQEGTLRVGDNLVLGVESGRVRAMLNDRGESIKEAGPATPVEVTGLGGVPEAGDHFQVVEATVLARKVSQIRRERQRQSSLVAGSRLTLEDLQEHLLAGETQEMPVVVKADVQGSVEVLREALGKLSGDRVRIRIIRAGAGGITESDVLLASASGAIVIGFNVRPERSVAKIAELEGVDVRLYTVIYQLIDEIKQAMIGKLEPRYQETSLGNAEVRDTFRIPRVGTVAGCYVTDGKFTRDARVRLLRDSRVIFEGRIGSLRRFKEDVREVQRGYECGVGIANYNDVKVGDVIEAYQVEQVEAGL
ncbi:MAG: translation initiation factor IF-2 [Acidobacteriota bacterium]